ncbi:MAG: hypothetical protein NPIRA03_18400 [Nitrospirales bacterium]|nr:MAG: hypothetical protein NPIRA03_18400 [Nitrospirales bacterium]
MCYLSKADKLKTAIHCFSLDHPYLGSQDLPPGLPMVSTVFRSMTMVGESCQPDTSLRVGLGKAEKVS